jgi:uncharacterized membrane protein YjgN (DUF898 family)
MNAEATVPSIENNPMGRFHGTGGELFAIKFLNGLLSILTLGIYSAWGRARIYQYFWSNTEFAGHRFRFTGNGAEIFRGLLKAVGVLIGIGVVYMTLFYMVNLLISSTYGETIAKIPMALFMVWLGQYALYGALVYRFSRTRYREVGFWLGGSQNDFARDGFFRLLLAVVTLGICYPLYRHFIFDRIYNNLRFGNLRFKWDAPAREYWSLSLKGHLLSIVTLGVYYFFWYPRMFAYVRNHLTLGGQRFHGDIRPGPFAGLMLTNLLIVVLTFGLGMPWVVVRTLDFFLRHLSLENPEQLEAALQEGSEKVPAGGEALADTLDAGLGLGF